MSPAVKLCIASRPWNIFNARYGGNPEFCLHIQDITRGDIETYTRGTLENDVSFQRIIKRGQSSE
jgi:hypothetical protein